MGFNPVTIVDRFFCHVTPYRDLLNAFQNVVLHYKWNLSEARKLTIDDFDDRGLFFWHSPLEKMDKEYKKMLSKKK